jgi:signal-transduction protein with cAMP-binding, CBS, and nucleotidyltransferase domain
VLRKKEAAQLAEAFDVVTGILLFRQIADYRAGQPVTYYVDPDRLTKAQRSNLLEALRVIDGLRKRVHLEFTGQIF